MSNPISPKINKKEALERLQDLIETYGKADSNMLSMPLNGYDASIILFTIYNILRED